MSSAPLDSRRNRLAWRLANLALRIGTREYRERLEGITRRGLGAAPRDDAAELRARIAELETTNFALSEDSALVANENAELRAALRTLVTDLEALMRYYSLHHDYTGEGHPEEVGWHDVLQGGRDNYLTNWREAKRLAGGEDEK